MLLAGGVGYALWTIATQLNVTNTSVVLTVTGVLVFLIGLVSDQIATLRLGPADTMRTDPLLDQIRTKRITAGVIGLGYVGLPSRLEFARAGVATVGFDIDSERTEAIGRGESYISDVRSDDLRSVVDRLKLSATTDFAGLAAVDTINICVPTPLRKTRDPDLSHVVAAVDQVAAHLRTGQLVVLESTTYPGTVDEVVRPRLEAGGLRAGRDFCLAFSPERIDPGNPEWTTRNIPRVVGGVDARSTEAATALYRHIVETVVPVSSPRVAEMVKLLENTFRAVNIGIVNELAQMCRNPRRRRLGGDRRGAHEAVRLHALLSGAGPRRPLHSGRSVLSRLEGAAARLRASLHRVGGPRERFDAALRRRADR